jgi:hypothetical protein
LQNVAAAVVLKVFDDKHETPALLVHPVLGDTSKSSVAIPGPSPEKTETLEAEAITTTRSAKRVSWSEKVDVIRPVLRPVLKLAIDETAGMTPFDRSPASATTPRSSGVFASAFKYPSLPSPHARPRRQSFPRPATPAVKTNRLSLPLSWSASTQPAESSSPSKHRPFAGVVREMHSVWSNVKDAVHLPSSSSTKSFTFPCRLRSSSSDSTKPKLARAKPVDVRDVFCPGEVGLGPAGRVFAHSTNLDADFKALLAKDTSAMTSDEKFAVCQLTGHCIP